MEISSRAATPESSAENEILTPNTKIARMLADIDKQFDEDAAWSPAAKSARDLSDAQGAGKPSSPSASRGDPIESSAARGPFQQDSDSEVDDSDGDVRRPQGRAARRMFAHQSLPEASEEAPLPMEGKPHDMADDREDEDLYSATPVKRLRTTIHHTGSPMSSPNDHGLFVSPAKSDAQPASDDDLPSHPLAGRDKLKELVAQKRAERLAKEAETEKRKTSESSAHPSSDLPDGDLDDEPDAPADLNIERIMSDASRPARKASKKALLEMERETQRMARQQALAHQMKTKKKFTTNDLFAKLGFRQQGPPNGNSDHPVEQPAIDNTSSSAPNSDALEEDNCHPVSTPPSSPPTPLDRQKALVDRGALSKLTLVRQDSIAAVAEVDSEEELPDMASILASSQAAKRQPVVRPEIDTAQVPQPPKGLKLSRLGKQAMQAHGDSSDDDLEILDKMPPHLHAFDKARGAMQAGKPAESRALHNLKHLSNMHAQTAPSRKPGSRPSLNPTVLEARLRLRAKEQARQLQLERIEQLKAKGIEIQSVEERDKEAEAFESLLEKARQQAVEIRRAEKAAAAGDEIAMQASDDEEEDADYNGSESEAEGEDEGEVDEEADHNEMFDEAPEETDEEVEEHDTDEDAMEDVEEVGEDAADNVASSQDSRAGSQEGTKVVRKTRKARIVQDEDDEDDELAVGSDHEAARTVDPFAENDDEDPFAAFDFGGHAAPLLSPTQAFNATMRTPTQATQEDSLDIFRRIAPPTMASLPPTMTDSTAGKEDGEDLENPFIGSQVPESQRVTLDWETQAPETPVPAGLRRDTSIMSETPGWEPTQDEGLPSPWTVGPLARPASVAETVAEHDTQSTVQLRVSESPAASPQAAKRGRLVRRKVTIADHSSGDEAALASVRPEKKNAFREMAKKRAEALSDAERLAAEKEMREMMDEQAEESEDEYAGLGGDDYVAPETEQDKAMIDSSYIEVDERALAAHYAERERLREEEETSRLYKDLTTGVLRRKMGANAFDLDEDESELALRRRQMRQREEAKRRKALLKDENIATLAEGKQSKGKDAFIKTIADDGGDDDMIALSDDERDRSGSATQDDSQPSQPQQLPLTETSSNKRRLAEMDVSDTARPPAKSRRTEESAFRRPTSLLEVQQSVSFLLEDQNDGPLYGPSALDFNSASEGEDENEPTAPSDSDNDDGNNNDAVTEEERRQNDGGYAPDLPLDKATAASTRLPAPQRRTPAAVVDRLSLKRINSASSSDSAHSRTAWAAGPATGGFKVPSLLRRATTSAAAANGANDRGVTTSTGAGSSLSRENSGGVRMGGSRKSNLAYQARAEERKVIVEASARRREENTRRIAEMRRTASAGFLGRGFGGRFE